MGVFERICVPNNPDIKKSEFAICNVREIVRSKSLLGFFTAENRAVGGHVVKMGITLPFFINGINLPLQITKGIIGECNKCFDGTHLGLVKFKKFRNSPFIHGGGFPHIPSVDSHYSRVLQSRRQIEYGRSIGNHVWAFLYMGGVAGIIQGVYSSCGGGFGCIGGFLQFREFLSNLSQRRVGESALPKNSSPSSTGDKYSNNSENSNPHLKTREWFAFPLFCICLGSGGVSWGVFFACLHGCNWRLVSGLGSIVAGLCLFLWGLNLIFAHMFFNVTQKQHLTSPNYRITVMVIGRTYMPNVLDKNKQAAIIS